MSSNAKPLSSTVAVEATGLGAPRTYTNGIVTIAALVDIFRENSEFYCEDTRSTWRIVPDPGGAPGVLVALLISGLGTLTGAPALPPPRVRLMPNGYEQGVTRSGQAANAFGQLIVQVEGMPQVYLNDSSYSLQLELLRYTPKRSRMVTQNGSRRSRPMPQGFYHPANWVNNVTPPTIAGTRGGSQSGVLVDRPTQWPLAGFAQNQTLSLSVASVLLPYFERVGVRDDQGTIVEALVYWLAGKRTRATGVWSYGRSPFRGVFCFRYAVLDASGGYFLTGPYSEHVFARPQKWPTRPKAAAGGYPHLREINLPEVIDPRTGESAFVQLTASVGGVVNGRMYTP